MSLLAISLILPAATCRMSWSPSQALAQQFSVSLQLALSLQQHISEKLAERNANECIYTKLAIGRVNETMKGASVDNTLAFLQIYSPFFVI